MHERSLVRSLLHQVNQIVLENDATEVDEITVEIGSLSGVEIELVRIAFVELTGNTKLAIVESPLMIRCLQCDQVSELTEFVFRCKSCDSGQVKVISGDEFRLLSVTLTKETTDAQ